jgi:esterase/lipase superfamily enzyme
VVRWGRSGPPLLLFPTAGGDAEECERFLMLRALDPFVSAGRLRVYSVDSVSGRVWIDETRDGASKAAMQTRFDEFVHREVPAIRADCESKDALVATAGQSIGAFNALSSLCRHPDVFSTAICMSGTYDLTRRMNGAHTLDFHYASPLHFLPYLDEGDQLAALRTRFVLLAVGSGPHESPHYTWRAAEVLGSKGIPNRVDTWGPEYPHDWPTWRAMLPRYVEEFVAA